MNHSSSEHQIDSSVLHRWIASGEDVLLIDLRGVSRDRSDTVPRITMQLHELPVRMCALPRSGKIVFACQSGRRSAAAAGYLREEGFEAWALNQSDETASPSPTELKLAVAEDR